MRINLKDGSVLDASFNKGKLTRAILWFSRKWIDFRETLRKFLKEEDNFLFSRGVSAGFFETTTKKAITSLTILKFAVWLDKND